MTASKRNRRRVGAWACCLGAALLASPALGAETPADAPAAEEAPAPFLGGFLTETRILYPLRVGDWQARDEHRYEQAELGVSVRYQHGEARDRWIDVYFYPAGVVAPDRVRRETEGTLEGIRSHAGYAQVEAEPPAAFEVAVGDGEGRRVYEGRSLGMRLQRDGRTYGSAMTLLAKDLYFIKGRYSAEGADVEPGALQAQLQDFTADLVRASRFYSTGACWMPPPIVRTAAPDAQAEGALMHTAVDGQVRAVAFADRVEAVDPDAPEATVMQMMSMTPSGRWIEGCHPPEDMTPAVPPDLREIRFEYRLPPARSDGTTPRLRGRRTGLG